MYYNPRAVANDRSASLDNVMIDGVLFAQALGQEGGSVTLKQEPLVMHIECRDLIAAERLLKIGKERKAEQL